MQPELVDSGGEAWVSGANRWVTAAVLYSAMVIVSMDSSVLNVAVPAIARTFAASTGQLQAIVDSYVVFFAGLLVLAGMAADRFGRRRALLLGLVLFAACSAAAAWPLSVWWLVGMRAGMGIAGALVAPATLALIVQVFPADERPQAFAAWFVVASVALALGPVLGGLLVSLWGWPSVFLINPPIAAAAILGIRGLVPESRDPDPGPLRSGAAAVLTLGLLALVTAAIGAGEHSLSTLTTLSECAVLGLVSLLGFVASESRARTPMIDLSWYRDRRFAGASATIAVLALGSGSALFVLTQYLQLVRATSALLAGLGVMPLAVGAVLGSVLGGRAPGKIGARRTVVIGVLGMAAGYAILATLAPASPYPIIGLGLFMVGAGLGFASPSASTLALAAIPADRMGTGSAVNTTHQQLGMAMGIAALGSVLATTYRAHLPAQVPELARGSLAETLRWSQGQPRGSELINAANNAFTHAQSVTMLISTACAVTSAALAAIVLPGRERPGRL